MSRVELPLSQADLRPDLRRLAAMPTWLAAAADEHRLRLMLETTVPEFARGQCVPLGCETQLRLGANGRWNAKCKLTWRDARGDPRTAWLVGEFRPAPRTADPEPVVRGVLGEPGWRAELPALGLSLGVEHESRLPALVDLFDATRALGVVETSLQGRWPGTRIESCAPEVVRHKPGSRSTIRYRLAYAPGSVGPETVVAKAHHGGKGRNAYAAMAALEQAGIPPSTVTLAEPLAYRDDTRVLLQVGVDEDETLEQRMRRAIDSDDGSTRAQLRHDVAAGARAIAAIHGSGVVHGNRVTWEDQLASTRGLVHRLAGGVGVALADVAVPYFEALAAAADRYPSDDLVASHGSFRPAQVLLSDSGVAVIDLDGFCSAEPALDVARFRASVRSGSAALRDRQAALEELSEHFLATYEHTATISRARVALWESLYLFHDVLTCWTKVRPARLPFSIATFERHLSANFAMLD